MAAFFVSVVNWGWERCGFGGAAGADMPLLGA